MPAEFVHYTNLPPDFIDLALRRTAVNFQSHTSRVFHLLLKDLKCPNVPKKVKLDLQGRLRECVCSCCCLI